jgi:hypothetical protein
MTRLDKVLDALHRFAEGLEQVTRRRKRWTRERITNAVGVGSSLISTLALAFPQVRGIAVAAGLMDAISKTEPQQIAAPDAKQTPDDDEKSQK